MPTPDIKQLMEQAKEMQKRMSSMQEQLGKVEVIGESGGGLVKITMTCQREVKKLVLADETWNEDREIIAELIIAAFNDAMRKVDKESKGRISALTKEIGLPAGIAD